MSAAPAKSPDPSMEEILASIRRIIADDTETAKQEADETADAAAIAAAVMAAARSAPSDPDDDVLDLAEIAKPPAARDVDAPPPEPPSRPDDAWADEAIPDEPAAVFAPRMPPHPVQAYQPAPPPAPEWNPTPPPERRPAAARTVSLADQVAESLVSSRTTASVGQAFNLLSHTVLSQNTITLEDIVRDMLKPMLKDWLDDNLPPMVERLVRAEIERVARGTR